VKSKPAARHAVIAGVLLSITALAACGSAG
jgi:hypothetical protein